MTTLNTPLPPFACQRCGACCRWPGIVRVSEHEISAIAQFLGLTEDAFIATFTTLPQDRQSLILTDRADGACVFLTEDNKCRINPVKPEQCQAFPSRWDVSPELRQLCLGRRRQLQQQQLQQQEQEQEQEQGKNQASSGDGSGDFPAVMHVLGHPLLPLERTAYPADAQVFNCHNFCVLLEHLRIPYKYYGIRGSRLPGPRGQFIDIGLPTGSWRYRNRWHLTYNRRLNRHLAANLRDDGQPELIASLYGAAQADVDCQGRPAFEPMLGYDHCWTSYRVFPSYAHQHTIYAAMPEQTRDTRFSDTVIPHFVEADHYRLAERPDDYLLYLGRDIPAKGIALARRCAEDTGLRLVMAHSGWHGPDKVRLIGQARAVLMPTLYVEPFGYVAIEAQMCGTPVITTDWGAFVETVEQGVTGFRCRTAAEFAAAVRLAPTLNRQAIRTTAVKRFSVEAVAKQYASYFRFVWNVHENGGYYTPDAFRNSFPWLSEQP